MKTKRTDSTYTMKATVSIMAWLAILPCLCPSIATSAPFQNGSFENGASGWNIIHNSGSDYVGGNGGIIQGATQGSTCYIFNPAQVYGNGIISQTFDTTIGTTYSVSFDYGSFGYFGDFAYTQQLLTEVRDGGVATSGQEIINAGSGSAVVGANGGFSFSQSGSQITATDINGDEYNYVPVPSNPQFSTVSFTFTALSGNSTLIFSDQTGSAGQFSDGNLDNVQVVQVVPEPSTWAMLAAGTGALLALRRRKRK